MQPRGELGPGFAQGGFRLIFWNHGWGAHLAKAKDAEERILALTGLGGKAGQGSRTAGIRWCGCFYSETQVGHGRGDPPGNDSHPVIRGDTQVGRPRVLIVDDDAGICDMLCEFLGHAYRVDAASNGMEALSVVRTAEQKVDLVVADLNMPEMNGVELMAAMPEDTPVIVISSDLDGPAPRSQMGDLRPAAAFRKPFSLAGLEQAIRGALGQ